MSFSDTVESDLLKVFKNEAPTKYEKVWVKLHTGDPGEAGTSNAASETARKQASFGAISSGSLPTNAALEWKKVTAAETYSHFSLWTEEAGGTCLCAGALEASKAVAKEDNFTIPSGGLTVKLDKLEH